MKKCQVVVKKEEPITVNNLIYGECQKNQATNIGGYAMDSCREFLASGAEGTSAAITCVACGCHRNFHKKMENIKVVCESSAPPAREST